MDRSFQDHLADLEPIINRYPTSAPFLRHVYLDLVLNKQWKQVEIKPIDSLVANVLLAHEPNTPAEDRLVILPRDHREKLSTDAIQAIFEKLNTAHLDDDSTHLHQLKKLTLAIVGSDSTVLYYHIHKGLVPPKEHV
ncbi:hypothetical protein DM01DRAFT_1339904 [Hesseltinella vesiculosa]|uniref:tRNA-splicing endonuclease subunit Sen15 domain-containing protein n=1 Tax=Hesseltinella vesiculosa TaxID=101127 RepID=A0A1X2G5P4_9FUNG|nr:hypothetical protein DM01DRAFT_1339904 [Hesseltinella vesiculosa]